MSKFTDRFGLCAYLILQSGKEVNIRLCQMFHYESKDGVVHLEKKDEAKAAAFIESLYSYLGIIEEEPHGQKWYDSVASLGKKNRYAFEDSTFITSLSDFKKVIKLFVQAIQHKTDEVLADGNPKKANVFKTKIQNYEHNFKILQAEVLVSGVYFFNNDDTDNKFFYQPLKINLNQFLRGSIDSKSSNAYDMLLNTLKADLHGKKDSAFAGGWIVVEFFQGKFKLPEAEGARSLFWVISWFYEAKTLREFIDYMQTDMLQLKSFYNYEMHPNKNTLLEPSVTIKTPLLFANPENIGKDRISVKETETEYADEEKKPQGIVSKICNKLCMG